VYLPRDELAAHGSSREHLVWLAGEVARCGPAALDDPFRGLMRAQIERARAHYPRGLAGVWRLPADCRLAIVLAGHLYQAILDAIEAADYDVFSRRAATSTWYKLTQALHWWVALHRPGCAGPALVTAPEAEPVVLAPASLGSIDQRLVARS
jgi:phytoene synthase